MGRTIKNKSRRRWRVAGVCGGGRLMGKATIEQARLLSQAMALEEYQPPRVVLYGVAIIVGLMAIAGVGAAIMPVVSSANARGVVAPIGAVKPVQHVDGGSVAEVFVDNGAAVEAGQPILRLSGDENRKRRDQVDAEYYGYLVEAERLRALLEERAPDFSRVPAERRELAETQQEIYRRTLEGWDNQIASLHERRKQAEANAVAARAAIRGMRSERAILQEEYDIFAQLVGKGYASKVRFLEVKKNLTRVVSGLDAAAADLAASEAAVAEATASIDELHSTQRQKVVDRLGEVSASLAQARETRARLQGSVDRLMVTAPRAGYVHKLKFRSPGAVIAPGDVIAEIVPLGEPLIVEAKLLPRDIGFVAQGQSARITVDGFDVSRYSVLQGTVSQISASSLVDEEGVTYFLANLAVDPADDANRRLATSLRPGMAVSASIVTGEGSFLRYLIRPVYDSLQTIFSER